MATAAYPDHAQLLIRWQGGESPPPGPYRITVFPTNICNIQCKHCWQRWADYDKTYKSEMSDERLLRLVDEAAEMGVRDWYFVGGGDPMGRRDVVMQMCEKIRAHGMNGGIHTNGTLFKPWMLERLVEMGWATLQVSLDGPNAEINDYIRSKGFDKAIDALKKLTEIKRERNSPFPEIGIYTTVTNMTFDKIDAFVELAHGIGSDVRCEISGLIVEAEGSAQFELNEAQKAAFPDHVRTALARARELGAPNNFEQYLNEELIHDGMDMHREFKPRAGGALTSSMCYEPWTSMAILPDGNVGPCCAFDGDGALSLKDKSLAEVWNGAYMTRVRAGMLNGAPPSYCRRCPSNLYVQKEQIKRYVIPQLDKARQWQSMGAGKRAVSLASRAIANLKTRGVKETFRRTKTWLALYGRKTA